MRCKFNLAIQGVTIPKAEIKDASAQLECDVEVTAGEMLELLPAYTTFIKEYAASIKIMIDAVNAPATN